MESGFNACEGALCIALLVSAIPCPYQVQKEFYAHKSTKKAVRLMHIVSLCVEHACNFCSKIQTLCHVIIVTVLY